MTGPAVSRKLGGRRAWKLVEVQRALEFLSVRLGRPVTYEEVFGIERPEGARARTRAAMPLPLEVLVAAAMRRLARWREREQRRYL
jgi:hypothetical protein